MNLDAKLAHIDHMARRQLQEILDEASSWYWERRAATFVDVGTETCFEIAAACRNAAALWRDDLSCVVCSTCGTPTSPWRCSCGETRLRGAA